MRILRIHNRYQERGGEDVSFESEVDLLRSHGQDVRTLIVTNMDIPATRSPLTSAALAVSTVWSRTGRKRVSEAIADFAPDIAHFDNTFPLISPAAYGICRQRRVPVVQTLHNYRMMCPASTLHRNGQTCEDCLGKSLPFPSIAHACYRNSRKETTAVAAMLAAHWLRRTWQNDVDRYIVMTDFSRQKFIEAGIPDSIICVKPHFIPQYTSQPQRERTYLLYAGRLTREKGIRTLVQPWIDDLESPPLRIIGSGPERACAEDAQQTNNTISLLGNLSRQDVLDQMRGARALIFPSEWYETFGLTIVEAFSCGTPVIASRMGVMTHLVDDGRTGFHFTPGDATDLSEKIRWAWQHPEEMHVMGLNARREYERRFTPEINYHLLMDVYRQAIEHATNRYNNERSQV